MELALKSDTCGYKRRQPEQELLHKVLAEHLETFLEQSQTKEMSLPLYVENELRHFLECGVVNPHAILTARQAIILTGKVVDSGVVVKTDLFVSTENAGFF